LICTAALHPVAAGLEAQPTEDLVAHHAQHHFLEAAEFALAGAHDLAAPAGPLGMARVHAQQVAGEERRFVAAGAGADLEEGVARVLRVLGQQQALQLVLERAQLGLGAGDLFPGHLGHIGVVQHLARGRQVRLALQVALVAARHLRHLGMLARDASVLRHVGHDVLAREQEVQLAEALRKALELLTQEGFHGKNGQSGKGAMPRAAGAGRRAARPGRR
jgi:hypothetical protein